MIATDFSLFPTIDDMNMRRLFAHYRGALKTISYQIEEAVLNGGVHTHIFAGFQKFSFFLPRMKRYRELARIADGVWIFGVPDVSLPPIPGVTYVPIGETHKLVEEWFLVVDSPEYFSALVAQDLSGFSVPASERRFRGIWTFDGSAVRHLQEMLSEALGLPPVAHQEGQGRNYRRQLNYLALSAGKLVDMLERRNRKLVQAQQLREDLSNMLVHDLRNPLAAIVASLNILQRGNIQTVNADDLEILNIAHTNANKMKNMVSDLLDIARLEDGKLSLSCSSFDPTDLLANAAERANFVASANDKTIQIEIMEPTPLVLGEPDKIGRVIDNLLDNALKYTMPGGIITLRTQIIANYVEFSVMDNGSGIEPAMLEKIFDKFAQANGVSQRYGTGLGLNFCRLIVEAHGGQIWATSQPGHGSTFYFTLPIASESI